MISLRVSFQYSTKCNWNTEKVLNIKAIAVEYLKSPKSILDD